VTLVGAQEGLRRVLDEKHARLLRHLHIFLWCLL
jgi:hypothetical protein